MPCPYLTEVTMVYCRASPVRKLIPADRVSTASHCDTECFGTCPLFAEALARSGPSLGEPPQHHRSSTDAYPPASKEGAQS